MSGTRPPGPKPWRRTPIQSIDEGGSNGVRPDADAVRIDQFRLDKDAAREHLARVLTVFYVLNAAVFLFVVAVWLSERLWPPARDAVITDKVVPALIAASTAQLGVLALSVGRSFWRGGG
jgi:hypothetical protein